jgi:hypothetical protein
MLVVAPISYPLHSSCIAASYAPSPSPSFRVCQTNTNHQRHQTAKKKKKKKIYILHSEKERNVFAPHHVAPNEFFKATDPRSCGMSGLVDSYQPCHPV